MSEISFCFIGDEDLDIEEGTSWDFTTKWFAFEVFGDMTQYDGVLSVAEQRIAEPAYDGVPVTVQLTPAEFEEALARATDMARRHSWPLPTPESMAENIREHNARCEQLKLQYQAAQPWVRQPAELLAVLQKIHAYRQAKQPDWSEYDDAPFEHVYAFLRRAIEQHRLVRWELFV